MTFREQVQYVGFGAVQSVIVTVCTLCRGWKALVLGLIPVSVKKVSRYGMVWYVQGAQLQL